METKQPTQMTTSDLASEVIFISLVLVLGAVLIPVGLMYAQYFVIGALTLYALWAAYHYGSEQD